MATFEELKEILGEPGFWYTETAAWRDLESELGVAFPEDFREFSDAYGPILINNQLGVAHPGVSHANLAREIRSRIAAWEGAPEGEVPYPVGGGRGELLPWGSASSGETLFFVVPVNSASAWRVGVYESDEGNYFEYAMSFTDWMVSYLRGEDVTVRSEFYAPDGPFFSSL